MTAKPERTLPLPADLSRRSPALAFAGIGYAAALFLGAWLGVGFLWSHPDWPWTLKGLAALPLLVAGGYGMLLMGFMGHDGTHFTLHENRLVSALLGIFVTAPVFPYLMGFTISHWNHHKYANTELDPDSQLFSRFRTLFSRAFLARPYAFGEYGLNTVRLALGRPLPFPYQFPLPPATVQRLAWVNLLSSLACFALYAAVAIAAPVYFFAWLAVSAFGTVISGLSPFIEHTGTDQGRGRDTRTAVGWWWDWTIWGNNYHLEHHLYPTVPFYRLKRAHAFLRAQGYYATEGRHVSGGAWDTYRFARAKYPYPRFAAAAKG